jgi:hypothetical protein
MSEPPSLPPTSELFNRRTLAQRHPHLLNDSRVAWALRNRNRNGLTAAGAVFDSPCGELFVHEPAFLTWLLGLTGRSKPRAKRRKVP